MVTSVLDRNGPDQELRSVRGSSPDEFASVEKQP